MELWIRSQDRKSLIKTTIVKYDRDYSNKAIIQGATDEDNWYTELGKYKNKERALEVLDEIQNILKPPIIMQKAEGVITTNDNSMHIINPTYGEIKQLDTYVYEMPEE